MVRNKPAHECKANPGMQFENNWNLKSRFYSSAGCANHTSLLVIHISFLSPYRVGIPVDLFIFNWTRSLPFCCLFSQNVYMCVHVLKRHALLEFILKSYVLLELNSILIMHLSIVLYAFEMCIFFLCILFKWAEFIICQCGHLSKWELEWSMLILETKTGPLNLKLISNFSLILIFLHF